MPSAEDLAAPRHPVSTSASSSTLPPPATPSSILGAGPPSSHSLAAAATMNAGIQSEDRYASQRSGSTGGASGLTRNGSSVHGSGAESPGAVVGGEGGIPASIERRRRRSSIRMSLSHNDPFTPAPGEMQGVSPIFSTRGGRSGAGGAHQRAPSLGEIHQELEAESEAQVNRLLAQIRQEQAQLAAHAGTPPTADDPALLTPTSTRSGSLAPSASNTPAISAASPAGYSLPPRTRSPIPIRPSRHSSSSRPASSSRHASTSQTGSPALGALPGGSDADVGSLPGSATVASFAGRDECAFYQAETQMLTRENQMLRMRIKELERQLADDSPTGNTSTPATHSPLAGRPTAPATDNGSDVRQTD
jgi:hypothetical protein